MKANPFTDEELDRHVLYFLQKPTVTAESRLDRWLLVEQVFGERVPEHERDDKHSLDREIRDSVKRLRRAGHLICDMGDGSGRWIAKSREEFWKFYGYFIKPITDQARTARAMKKSAERLFPDLLQPSLFGGAREDVPADLDEILEAVA